MKMLTLAWLMLMVGMFSNARIMAVFFPPHAHISAVWPPPCREQQQQQQQQQPQQQVG